MSSIVTFYSYKGGVGRTMAMANVAVLLAQRQLRVLAVDWDLEAPGLERYFAYFSVAASRGGLLRLLRDQQRGSRGHYQQHLTRVTGTLATHAFELHVLPSGRETDPDYSALLERFNWDAYFADGGGDFIEDLRMRWRKEYDVVLVDSRTGLSDTGGICTIQLPDVVVAMFTANYQSLHGVRDTMRLAQTARDRLAYDRMRLRVLPVPSRFSLHVDTPEAREWLDRISEALGEFYQDWIPTWATARQVTEALRIPQLDAFGFGEKLALLEEEATATRPMTSVYSQIADLLAAEVPDAAAILDLAPPAGSSAPTPASRKPSQGYEYDLFVSRAAGSVLNEWSDAIIAALRTIVSKRLGREVRVFQDLSEVRVDEVWKDTIAEPLVRSRVMLALVSPEFLSSRWCRLEWATFERREMEHPARSPLIVAVALQPLPSRPDWMARRELIDVSDLPRRRSAFEKPSPEIRERLERLATAVARRVRSAPPFDPAWTVVEDLPSAMPTTSPVPTGTSEIALDADALTALLKIEGRPDALDSARKLVPILRRHRDFAALARVAEAIHQHDPDDHVTALHYARALIETGELNKAQKLLTALLERQPKNGAEFGEAMGLLGRISKQQFVGSASKRSSAARAALTRAIDAYHAAYQADPAHHIWFGVNVVALLSAARRHAVKTGTALSERRLARKLLAQLDETPESLRASWDVAHAAELHLALGNWEAFGEHLHRYMNHPDIGAFELNAFLRQLMNVWEMESDPVRGAPHVAALRARVLSTPGGSVDLRPPAMPAPAKAAPPRPERFLGEISTVTLDWYRLALQQAESVGVVLDRSDHRVGTCFLVQAQELGIDRDECLVVTAAHVVSSRTDGGIKPREATVVFEAWTPPRRFKVAEELWTSPRDQLDATLLRLEPPPIGLAGLHLATLLPQLLEPQRVYVIGHADGRDLSISLQDNELLDHEGPPEGTPSVPGIIRLHYRAATGPGSSGSPVFNDDWRVIALHHHAGPTVARLNGKPGTYAVSEGIWIQSIVTAPKP